MRHRSLVLAGVLFSFNTAHAEVTVGDAHVVENVAALDLPYGHAESVRADGTRDVFEWTGNGSAYRLVRHHYSVEGSEIGAPKVLVATDVESFGTVVVRPGGTVEASWLSRPSCELGLASFTANAVLEQKTSYTIDRQFCDTEWNFGYLLRGLHFSMSGAWYLVRPNDSQAEAVSHVDVFRYDFSGVGPVRTIELLHDGASPYADISQIAFDADGSFVNSWTAGEYGSNVYARVYDADGSPRSGLLTLAQIEGQLINDLRPLALAPGKVLVAWRYSGWTGRELALDGDTTTTTTTTTTTLEDSPQVPELGNAQALPLGPQYQGYGSPARLATDGNGVWVVAWPDGGTLSSYTSRVAVNTSRDNGRTWSGPVTIGEGQDVAVAVDGDGNWLLAATQCDYEQPHCYWTFWHSRDGARTWTTTVDPASGTWTGSFDQPHQDLYSYSYGSPALASSGDGRWTLASVVRHDVNEYSTTVERLTDVFVATSSDDAASWQAAGTFTDEMHSQVRSYAPAILARTGRDSLVTWKLSTLRGFELADAAGHGEPRTLTPAWSDATPLPEYLAAEGFSAASDDASTLVAVWASRSLAAGATGWDSDILFSRSSDGGETWTHPAPITPRAYGDSTNDATAQIATSGHGQWLVAWQTEDPRFVTPPEQIAFVAVFSNDDGQTWSAPERQEPGDIGDAQWVRLAAVVADGREPSEGWAILWTSGYWSVPAGPPASVGWLRMTEHADLCGNGALDVYEECDDGNSADGDGCDSNCTPTACGNGAVSDGEECDDGNFRADDSCSPSCKTTYCGDGIVRWDGEECDDANLDNTDSCMTSCVYPRCGDGFVYAGVEDCDDGNYDNDDGCQNNCKIPVCGDGEDDTSEACDDGNTNDNDSCRNNCEIAACGDGVVRSVHRECSRWYCRIGWVEGCDDGNSVDDDACTNNCQRTYCGDGTINPGELCDDSNGASGDGCDANCTPTGCGNGAVAPDELCDDGNAVDGDYCSSDCNAFPDNCGDANDNGEVTAIDAAQVLRTSVDLPPGCEMWSCDVNTSGTITAVDGGIVLRKAVGLDVREACENRVVIHVATARPVNAIQFHIEHPGAPGTFREAIGEMPRCDLPVDAIAAAGVANNGLTIALVSLTPLEPQTIVCRFRRFAPVSSEGFVAVVEDSVDEDGYPVPATISVEVE